jgi:hypothetical protein
MTDPEIPPRGYETKDVEQQRAPAGKSFVRRHWRWVVAGLLIGLPALVLAVWTAGALAYAYSAGDRIGYVQKLSQKGWLCKTWEGELQMSNIPGSAPVLFEFTVRDDSIARAITAAEGRPVSLHFEQHTGIPLSCFGDTEYFITGVRVVNTAPTNLMPPAPTPVPTVPPKP